VSLVNSLHYRFINEAISLGKHVIVDKPIALDNYEVVKLIKKAKKKKLILSEALTFNYHKQFSELKKIINKNKPIKNIIMKFNIPKPKKNDFRLNFELGGGCFNDMIPYAAEVNRIFLKKNINIKSFINKTRNRLSDSFSLNTTNKKVEFYGFFSHNSEYENFIIFSSDNYFIKLDRFCAPPSNINLLIKYKKKNILKKIKIKKDDMFLNFFIEFFDQIKKNQYNYYYKKILFNADFKKNVIRKKS
jgi:predicted dehydrogenase